MPRRHRSAPIRQFGPRCWDGAKRQLPPLVHKRSHVIVIGTDDAPLQPRTRSRVRLRRTRGVRPLRGRAARGAGRAWCRVRLRRTRGVRPLRGRAAVALGARGAEFDFVEPVAFGPEGAEPRVSQGSTSSNPWRSAPKGPSRAWRLARVVLGGEVEWCFFLLGDFAVF